MRLCSRQEQKTGDGKDGDGERSREDIRIWDRRGKRRGDSKEHGHNKYKAKTSVKDYDRRRKLVEEMHTCPICNVSGPICTLFIEVTTMITVDCHLPYEGLRKRQRVKPKCLAIIYGVIDIP